MRWFHLLILAVLMGTAVAINWWPVAPTPAPAVTAYDLTALRLQATDLQRAVETLARTPDPDPAAMADLATRLQALARRLDQIEGRAP